MDGGGGLVCRNEERRRLVRSHPGLNGLDYLEVSDDQRTLTVYFLDKAPDDLVAGNVRVTGGRRVTGIRVVGIDVCRSEDPERDDCLSVTVDRPGDFSCYRLCIVEVDGRGRPTDRPRADFDPRYACLDFTFKAGCPTGLDCVPAPCPPEVFDEPEIDYLAKDYATFRRLLLDRLALLVPEWTERHVPDVGIALVEVLAYVGDHLSYFQDAVATEAYLDTARLRISVRRHARLVDYLMHEGCTARAWVSLETDTDRVLEGGGLAFVTSVAGLLPTPVGPVISSHVLDDLPGEAFEWFEPVRPGPIHLRAAHSEIRLYTWGDTECCVPAGATGVTLVDALVDAEGYGSDEPTRALALRPGDHLLLEEVLGPRTGHPADADPAHRHVVRLTSVEPGVDAVTGQPIVEVAWAREDALPFPLCVSAVGPPPACELLDPVSVARANVVLVDHGRTVDEELGTVGTVEVQQPCADGCPADPVLVPARFRPVLGQAPLTFSDPAPLDGPATGLLRRDPRRAGPALDVRATVPPGGGEPQRWWPRPDLLASTPDDLHVVVEVDDDGAGHLRFGDGVLGRAPAAGTELVARYRVGNGPAGNVGAEAIAHLVTEEVLDGLTLRVRNPLAATGGMPPEPVAEVKAFAPSAFRRNRQRAVTAADYAELARRDAGGAVQRAAAELRWTGSWYEVVVAVDALGRTEPPPGLLAGVARSLERYRRIAHDVRVVAARTVPLDLALLVCVAGSHRRADVLAALLDRFGNCVLADGTTGLFHPDALTFGDPVRVSRLVAEAAAVPGVDNVVVTRLRRWGEPDDGALDRGVLRLAPDEVARLDNDRSFPEHGVLEIELRGGR